MSLPTFNTKSPTMKRILREATELRSNPDATLHASPLESNLFEWHFTLQGPPSTPYASGLYHGRIILPPTYPLRPPSFRFLTPSGRFEVNREICLSISGHHEETWQPAWGIRTALWALRAFMEGSAKGQVGGMDMGEGERKRLAAESRSWKCHGCGGGSNEEILKAEEERCKGLEGTDGSAKAGAKEEIPNELRFGFRDEMGKDISAAKGKEREPIPGDKVAEEDTTATDYRRESVHFAGPEDLRSLPSPVPISPSPAPANAPVQPVGQPLPTRTTPSPTGSADNGVPGWVDKAIVGIVAEFVDYYKALGIRPEATSKEVRSAYHQRSLLAHPDKHPAPQSKYWNQVQLKINAAKDVLMDPDKRASYDRTWARKLESYFNDGGEQKPPHAFTPPRTSEPCQPSQPSQPSQRPQPPRPAYIFVRFAAPEDTDAVDEWLFEDYEDSAEGYASRYAETLKMVEKARAELERLARAKANES
ncbi:MAG: hypothetical protein Q9208_000439 [Pyrenodesmia sp. 3 TL-2023]